MKFIGVNCKDKKNQQTIYPSKLMIIFLGAKNGLSAFQHLLSQKVIIIMRQMEKCPNHVL